MRVDMLVLNNKDMYYEILRRSPLSVPYLRFALTPNEPFPPLADIRWPDVIFSFGF